ncbi:MAG: choice-of-anchor D domain-containing protein [Terracidiphilus sp.]
MNNYQHPTENRIFFSPDREPSLNLSVPVAHIAGLDNYSMPRPAYTVTGSAPDSSYMSSDMRAAYYTTTEGETGLTGSGQIVGLYAASGYNINDVNTYFSNAGQTNNVPIFNVLLDGLTGVPPNGGSPFEFEIDMDMEQVLGMAPGLSQLRVYEGVTPEDILNAMASENLAKQLSTSVTWGPDFSGTIVGTDDAFFMEYAAQGQSFFSASGDGGANSTEYPAMDAWVTAVGGTSLYTNGAGGAWESPETAWGGSGSGYGSGGGYILNGGDVPIPTYQAGLNGVNGASTTLRNVPDVAMNANAVYFCASGSCGDSGGTSASSPLWAGFMALVNQQAAAAGEPPLGFLNPYIYAIGGGTNYNGFNYNSSSYGNDFHDITIGDNDVNGESIYYSAGTGYDLVTGWGSPKGQNLINDLAPLTGPPAPSFTLTASQGYLTINPNIPGTDTITVKVWGGFIGSVNLSVSGLPSGVTASWGTNPTTETSVLTLTASSTATTNGAIPTLLTITGSSGALTSAIYINLTITPQPTNPPEGYVTSGVNFAFENIGATSAPQPLTFTFDSSITLGSVSVLTQGVTGLDFTNAGSGTCAPNAEFIAGQTCTVNVTFTPRYAGTRDGAVVLNGTNGNVIATGYLRGSGVGPQVNFLPNTESTVASQSSGGLLEPYGVAVDGGGNIYIADTGNNRIVKETLSAGSYTQGTIPTSSLSSPSGVAADGAGNLYIADTDNQRVLKETLTTGGYTESVIVSFPINTATYISSIAVDGSGKVYFVGGGTLYEETLSEGSYTQSIIPTTGINNNGITVDGSGNIYIADNGNQRVVKLSAGSYAQTIIPIPSPSAPTGAIAVDDNGNVYLTVYPLNGNFGILKETLSLLVGSYTQSTIATSPLYLPLGIAVDGSGNVYIANSEDFNVLKEDFADPPSLSFANTAVGSTSTDSPRTVMAENIGTASLNSIVPTITGTNPSDFAISTGTNACGSTLAAGSSCSIYVAFTPASAASFTATLSVADSASGSPQTATLTGTGTAPVASLSSPLAFPNTLSGTTSSALAATLSNTGTAALNNIVASIAGTNPGDFALTTGANACGATLTAGSSCSIYVTFTPASAASFTATLSVADSASSSPQTATLTGSGTAPAPTAWPNGYNYQATFTVAAGKVSGAQTNFPALISGTYADFATTANGGRIANSCNQTIGSNITSIPCDLIFTSDAAGTQLLSWEYETYKATTGAVNIWVNVPNLASGTVIYAWYGQPSVTTLQTTPTATWTNYMAVYHLKENPAGTAPQLNDSTGNGNNATMQGTVAAGQQQPGEIDGSINFEGDTWAGLASSSSLSFERTDSFSLSGWYKIGSNTIGALLTKVPQPANAGWELVQFQGPSSPQIALGLFGTNFSTGALAETPQVTMGAWHYVVATFSGTGTVAGMNIYIDGVKQTLTTMENNLATSILNADTPAINSRATAFQESNDAMDEIRVSAKGVVFSPALITTNFNNQSSPATFFTVATGLTNP